MRERPGDRSTLLRGLLPGIALAVVLGGVLIGARLAVIQLPVTGHPFVQLYDPPADRIEAMFVVADGQAYAALGQDPTLARPEVFRASNNSAPPGAEAAYRAQRPLLGWLVWLTSFGQPGLVGPAMLLLDHAGLAAVVLVVGATARHEGRRDDLAPLALLVPGVLVVVACTGIEMFAAAAALGGLLALRRGHRWWACALLCLGALGRESMLLVTGAALLAEAWPTRGLDGRRSWEGGLRRTAARALPLALPAAAWVAWVAVVRLRFGYWPTAASQSRLGAPFGGLLAVIGPRWSVVDAVVALLGLGAAIVAFRRGDRLVRAVVTVHVAFATVMGDSVWASSRDFSRVLLPLYLLGLIALLPGCVVHEAPRRRRVAQGLARESTPAVVGLGVGEPRRVATTRRRAQTSG